MATIPDKALMVFKMWTALGAGDGDGLLGGGGAEGGDFEGGSALVSGYYERWGQGWQSVAVEGADEGKMDMLSGGDGTAYALFKINIGLSGLYRVQVHYPPSADAMNTALYEVFLIDYTEDPLIGADLGLPLISIVLDQSDSDAYTTTMDEEGYVNLGEVPVAVDEGNETKMVVVRLSVASSGETDAAPTGLLLADSVRLLEVE